MGTTTSFMSSSSARAAQWRPPAPPNAKSEKSRGSRPRTTDTARTARRIVAVATEKIPYAIERYRTEAHRLYGVLNHRLGEREFLCGDYSIADMACWPWVITYKSQGFDLATWPNVRSWYDRLKGRPGLRRGYDVGSELRKATFRGPDEEARKHLFGSKGAGQ